MLLIPVVPVAPSISAAFPINDGMLVYPEIGCLTDDIANYIITVSCDIFTVPLVSVCFTGWLSIYYMFRC